MRRHHDRQIAKAGILGQHREESIDHARAKTFAEHDAVDVAGIEMFGRGLDQSAPTTPVRSPSDTDSAG